MKVLVVGATGTIGKEVARQFQEEGHEVVQASRKSERSIDIEDNSSIERFFNEQSGFDALVCVTGNASFGKLSELSDEQIRLGANSKLLGQVNLVKKGLGKLNPRGKVILTGGMLAYSPWPSTSNIAMANAGLEGFVKALALEMDEDRSVNIVHPPLVSETAEAMGMDASPWPSAEKVAKTYVKCLTSKGNGDPIFVDGYVPEERASEVS